MRLAADRADIFGFRFDGKNISRFHLAPINTGYAERNIPTPKLSEFHERRSSKFIGISWVGNGAVSPEYVSNDTTAVINVGEKAWSELAERIGCLGSVPGIQLGCRYSLGPAPRKWTRGERAPYLARCREFIENLTDERIDVILSAFARGIQRAAEMGFKAVQIHAAHGIS